MLLMMIMMMMSNAPLKLAVAVVDHGPDENMEIVNAMRYAIVGFGNCFEYCLEEWEMTVDTSCYLMHSDE